MRSATERLRVVHTVGGLFPEHGGPSRSVPGLCDALAESAEVTVVTASPESRKPTLLLPKRAAAIVVPEPERWGRLRAARTFTRALESECTRVRPGLIHDHGLWLPSNHAASVVAARTGVRRVVSLRGMLSPWSLSHHGLRKRVAWMLYQRADLDRASAFHATSEKEAEELRAVGLVQPIAVIPNGVEPFPSVAGASRERAVLFLSRLHPKKGVDLLLRAWSAAGACGWKLLIAGPDEGGYRAVLEREAESLRVSPNVEFLGELRGEAKAENLRHASLFVLPSHDENYGIVVAEALAAGLPVITTTATPWRAIESAGAGWIVDPSEQALAKALREALSLQPGDLQLKGERGRAWVQQTLAWPAVADRMLSFYRWLLDSGRSKPDWVLA